jgi:hypothetical protein
MLRPVLSMAALLLIGVPVTVSAPARAPGPTVQLCTKQIVFTAHYLAESKAGEGTGFLFRIENQTAKPITLAEPVPSSAHWYARVGSRWLWRASSGTGGSLVDAINERGPLFAYRPKAAPADPKYITVPAHGNHEWEERVPGNPVLDYRPSCALCNYPGEHEYKAVFAYAYLPPAQEHVPDLLACGLRSNLVIMPPKFAGK